MYALLIGNKDYSKKREADPKWQDLETVDEDILNVKAGLKSTFGMTDSQIFTSQEVSFPKMKAEMGKITTLVYENGEAGKKTLVFVYYAGHGQMQDNYTRIVLNDENGKCYPLEKVLRNTA